MEVLSQKRNYSLDIVRIVAVFCVVLTHCSSAFLSGFPQFSGEFVFGNLFDSLSRIGVPLFLMISGALFLDQNKEVTLKTMLTKNVKSLAVITIIWAVIYSVIYNVVFPLSTGNTVKARSVIGGILGGQYHMWYLFMIIGLYIITPFLRKFVSKENKDMVLFFIVISFCFKFFAPVITAICQLGLDVSYINAWINKFNLDFFGGYTAYFLTGWYIVHIGIQKNLYRYSLYLLGLLSLLSIIFYVYYTGDYSTAYKNIGAPVFLFSLSVFLALNSINWKIKDKTAKKLVTLSKLVFGVYIVHVLVLTLYTAIVPYSKNSALYIVTSLIAVSCISFLISFALSKIPVLKKLIKA